MKRRRSHPRISLKTRAEKYLDRASDLYIFSENSRPALLREALVMARKALLIDPRNYEALLLLGNIISDIDQPRCIPQALRYYDQAIALRPEIPDSYAAKAGLLMYWLGQPEEAELLERKALALSVHGGELSEFSYSTLIDILIGRKKFAQARWLIRKALRDCPSEVMRDMVADASQRDRSITQSYRLISRGSIFNPAPAF
jgi:tetratricopeptide (TPR) repeat protein